MLPSEEAHRIYIMLSRGASIPAQAGVSRRRLSHQPAPAEVISTVTNTNRRAL